MRLLLILPFLAVAIAQKRSYDGHQVDHLKFWTILNNIIILFNSSSSTQYYDDKCAGAQGWATWWWVLLCPQRPSDDLQVRLKIQPCKHHILVFIKAKNHHGWNPVHWTSGQSQLRAVPRTSTSHQRGLPLLRCPSYFFIFDIWKNFKLTSCLLICWTGLAGREGDLLQHHDWRPWTVSVTVKQLKPSVTKNVNPSFFN